MFVHICELNFARLSIFFICLIRRSGNLCAAVVTCFASRFLVCKFESDSLRHRRFFICFAWFRRSWPLSCCYCVLVVTDIAIRWVLLSEVVSTMAIRCYLVHALFVSWCGVEIMFRWCRFLMVQEVVMRIAKYYLM